MTKSFSRPPWGRSASSANSCISASELTDAFGSPSSTRPNSSTARSMPRNPARRAASTASSTTSMTSGTLSLRRRPPMRRASRGSGGSEAVKVSRSAASRGRASPSGLASMPMHKYPPCVRRAMLWASKSGARSPRSFWSLASSRRSVWYPPRTLGRRQEATSPTHTDPRGLRLGSVLRTRQVLAERIDALLRHPGTWEPTMRRVIADNVGLIGQNVALE